MNKSIFSIGAEGIDTDKIMAEIRATVEAKREKGCYLDSRVAMAEKTNLANIKDDEEFLSFYLECLRDAAFVDISDFEIIERRTRFAGLLVALKRTIWKLLKFYTYRLWSQQNQINGLLLSATESLESTYRERISELEKRVAELEKCQKPNG